VSAPKHERTIFVVTVFGGGGAKLTYRSRKRTWGWYSTWAAAHRAIAENHTDMFESLYYDTAVIEEYDEGILTESVERGWFRATEGPGEGNDSWLYPKVEKIDRPEWAAGICGWGMG